MSEFVILPPGRSSQAGVALRTSGSGGTDRSAVLVGDDGVVSRTQVPGDPTREVIRGVYREGSYIVTGPRVEPPRRQPVYVREHDDEIDYEDDEQAQANVQRVTTRR